MTVNIHIRLACSPRKRLGKGLGKACRASHRYMSHLGYKAIFHLSRFRDHDLDAPSYNEQFATHEEDNSSQLAGIPRFAIWRFKTGSYFADATLERVQIVRPISMLGFTNCTEPFDTNTNRYLITALRPRAFTSTSIWSRSTISGLFNPQDPDDTY